MGRLWAVVLAFCLLVPAGGAGRTGTPAAKAGRTLRVLESNPRYFTNGSGRAIYLTGSHVWWNLVSDETFDFCLRRTVTPFRYGAYLDELARHGHNFIRLWTWELMRWSSCGTIESLDLHPWQRSGPGLAVDGKPRFDLRRFDPKYFARLRARVQQAQRRGLYVSVMLFEGWTVQFEEDGWGWRGNLFNPRNNANGVDGDTNGDGRGNELHTLRTSKRVIAIQDAYVRKVVDTVNRFDNVLYEIANESSIASIPWQYRLIDLVKRYERGKPKRHPVGMTYVQGDHANTSLRRSRADWISPHGGDWLTQPPPADGRKVVLLDTDHLCGVCGGSDFVWKSFLRGYNPIFMDPFDASPERIDARRAMGATRRLALTLPLARMRPRFDLSSTGYCLAAPGSAYVVYQPRSGPFRLDVGRAKRFAVEWRRPLGGRAVRVAPTRLGGRVTFRTPWNGPAVLVVRGRR